MTEKLFVEKLEKWGADPGSVLEGMQGDMDFYRSMLRDLASDQELLHLENEILQGDPEEAFMKVHSLRGGAGCLGLTPLTEILAQLTELLRGPEDTEEEIPGQTGTVPEKEKPEDVQEKLKDLSDRFVRVRQEFLSLTDQLLRD